MLTLLLLVSTALGSSNGQPVIQFLRTKTAELVVIGIKPGLTASQVRETLSPAQLDEAKRIKEQFDAQIYQISIHNEDELWNDVCDGLAALFPSEIPAMDVDEEDGFEYEYESGSEYGEPAHMVSRDEVIVIPAVFGAPQTYLASEIATASSRLGTTQRELEETTRAITTRYPDVVIGDAMQPEYLDAFYLVDDDGNKKFYGTKQETEEMVGKALADGQEIEQLNFNSTGDVARLSSDDDIRAAQEESMRLFAIDQKQQEIVKQSILQKHRDLLQRVETQTDTLNRLKGSATLFKHLFENRLGAVRKERQEKLAPGKPTPDTADELRRKRLAFFDSK